jgi:hypothetical protein
MIVWICFFLTGCGEVPANTPEIVSSTDPEPEIRIEFTGTEAVELVTETVAQPNCEGTAEVENQIQKSRSIEHIIEAAVGVSVNVNGQVGFAGTDIELGATVAEELGTSYGTAEIIARSLTVKARPGTNMQHQIRLTELWKAGTADVKVGDQETTVPFRFRHDFAIELVSSKDIGCAQPAATSIFATPTQTLSPSPTTAETVGVTQTPGSILPQTDTGWRGEYFDNTRFQEPAAFIRTDPAPIFDWRDGNPAPGIPIDDFSVRWTRCLAFEDRYYVFTARGDNSVRVYVDDIFVLEAGGNNVERAFAVSAGQHCIKLELVETWGNASVYFDLQPGDPYQSADESTAWRGEYFDNTRFEEPAVYTRNDPAPIFDWKDSNPAPGIPIDDFSVRWARCLTFEDRYYVFTARGDNSVRVFADDIFVLEAGGNNVDRAFAVSAGQHCIKLELLETWGNASVYFDLQPGDPYPSADESTAWRGEYFDNTRFQEPAAFIRNDPAPIFDWKDSNPAPGIPIDDFSVRWTRCLNFEDREYIFTARADNNVRVYLDGTFVLEAGGNNVERAFAISAGQHCIKLELLETWGNASVYFDFK